MCCVCVNTLFESLSFVPGGQLISWESIVFTSFTINGWHLKQTDFKGCLILFYGGDRPTLL